MHEFGPDVEETDGTVFRDIIMLALLGFVTIVVLLLPHLNPPTKQEASAQPPGNVVVEARWPDDMNVDVDLWVRGPNDRAVGYSSKGSTVFNLLRDDLGHFNDQSKLNYEMAYSRGLVGGEYVVNLHFYSNAAKQRQVPVNVAVGVKRDDKDRLHYFFRKDIVLNHLGEEKTVVRFALGENGQLVAGTIHDLPVALRSDY